MILIISAMEEEINIFLKALPFKKVSYFNEIKLYNYNSIIVAISQIGEVNAAITLTSILKDYSIEKIYNIGSAGSLKQKFKLFDIAIIKSAVYLFADSTVFGYKYGQIPKEKEEYQSNIHLLKNDSLFPKAVLGSSDIFVANNFYYDWIYKKFNNQIDLIDMEGASFYHVANKFNIPILSIKVISDNMTLKYKLPSEKQFNKNIDKIGIIIKEFILKYII